MAPLRSRRARRLTLCNRKAVLARSDPRGVGRGRHPHGRSCLVSRSLARGPTRRGDTAFIKALVLCILAGLIWQFVLTLILVRRERHPSLVAGARRSLAPRPRDPRSGRVGGRSGCGLSPSSYLFFIWEFFGFDITGPASHDFALPGNPWPGVLPGNWGWFAVLIVELIFNTVLGEDLLFRGLLLPRMRASSGRRLRGQRGAFRLLPSTALVNPRRTG